jgi:hypothetical protein
MPEIPSTIPTWAIVTLGLLILAQITLDVIALVDLYRRPPERVVFTNRWIWLAIILLVNTVGAILYLVAGRKPAPTVVPAPGTPLPGVARPASAQDVADTLYGPPPDDQR